MRKIWIVLIHIVLMASLLSCYHFDGMIQERNINLLLITNNPDQYKIYLNYEDREEQIELKDGFLEFRTPKLWFADGYFLGIPIGHHVNDIKDFFQIKEGDKVIISKSCNEILELPKNDKGISELTF